MSVNGGVRVQLGGDTSLNSC